MWNGDPFKYLIPFADFDPLTYYHSNGIDQVAGINDYGRAVVNGYLQDTGGKKHALLWKKYGDVALDLGTFPGGKESIGYEINNQNMIAGTHAP